MAELWSLLIGTLGLRPYVFAFLAGYLIAAAAHLGWRRTLVFIPIGYGLAWLSEFSSIHWGLPYGHYYYIEATRYQELWVAGVPFMDSLSYVFLAYSSYATALLLCAPTRCGAGGLLVLETRRIRRSPVVWVLAGFLMMFLDIIIDPVALQGKRWFLGQIYGYSKAGLYFGIPLSNFLGWLLVGLILVGALQALDRIGMLDPVGPNWLGRVPWIQGLGTGLYLGVLGFNLAITWWIGEVLPALVGSLLVFFPMLLGAVFLRYKNKYLPPQAWADHLADFPQSPARQFLEQSRGRSEIVKDCPEVGGGKRE